MITVAQQKGGSGKTTLAANLAVAAVGRGQSVAVIDTDPQGSLGQWFMTRRAAMHGGGGIDFATASAWGVAYECEKLRAQHDLIVIDTPPKIDADLRPALRESDLIIVPVATSHVDLWATQSVLDLAARENRRALLVLNRAAARAKLTDEIASRMADLPAVQARARLGNRVIFAEVLGAGGGVSEKARTGPAAAEIGALLDEIAAMLAALST